MLKKKQKISNCCLARADADRQVHQAQALWSACSALWSTLREADPTKPWQTQLRPLKTEVEAVRKASGELKSEVKSRKME